MSGKTDAQRLEEASYIRAQLFSDDRSSVRKYADLVVGRDAGYASLVGYELVTFLLGGVRGALGLLLRKKVYPRLFKRCGTGVIFGRNLTIRNGKNITLGDHVVLDDDCVLDARGAGPEGVRIGDRVILNRGVSVQAKIGPISIGDDSDIGMRSDIHSQGGVSIGRDVVLGGSAKISGGIFQIERSADGEGDREQARRTAGPITIGDKCLVGMGSMFLDGVTVGRGSVLGAGSLILKSLPDYCVAAGSPARVLQMRDAVDVARVE